MTRKMKIWEKILKKTGIYLMIMASRQINIFIDCEVYNLSAHYNLSQMVIETNYSDYVFATSKN